MKFMKQVVSLCLALALLCGFLPLGTRAEETASEETVAEELLAVSQEQVVEGCSEEPVRLINPYYAHLVTEEAFVPASGARVQTRATPVVVTSAEEAAKVLRQNMKKRQSETSVCINIQTADEDYMLALADKIFNIAVEHTGVPNEGDYLAWIWYDGEYSFNYEGVQGDIDLTLNYTCNYTTTAAQEAEMDSRVAALLSELNLGGKSDYEKIKGIYHYICTHVVWDADHQDDIHMQSAYAALVKGSAAHKGFAILMYRLALELGVDCRVISGKLEYQGASLTHLWNIVELNGQYYNADSFADYYFFGDDMAAYQFFLSCPETTFIGHTRDSQYNTDAFNAAYPMASENYSSLKWNLDENGLLTISGSGEMTARPWADYADQIVTVSLADGITSIADSAFADCATLTSVTIPDSVTRIGEEAFYGCDGLSSIAIPESVTYIGESAFYSCDGLSSIAIPDSVTYLGGNAFNRCKSLASVSLSKNIPSIEGWTFYKCSSLTKVTIPDGVSSIDQYAFAYCENLISVKISDSVTSIGKYAFCDCTNLAEITIPDSVTYLGGDAFNRCKSLASVSLSKNIPSIEDWTFYKCSSLTKVTIPDGVISIGECAFTYCENLISVKIPDSVTSIGERAFDGCTSLTEITIPSNVTSIGDGAIEDCSSLSKIYFTGNAPEFGEDPFNNVTATVYYPANNKTWTPEVMQDYGGDLTWVPYSGEEEHKHNYTSVITKPTCTEKGYTTYTCSCGDTYTGNEVAALGHKWDNGIVTREPSAQAPGIRTFTCTVCKTTRTEEIPYEAPVVSDSVYRISGKDRVKTALSVARALKDTLKVEKFDAVIIATGVNEKFADALAGSYLANRKKAPILLYTNSGLSQLNVNFIKENLKANGTVYILGGNSAVPTTVEQILSAYNVVRLSGKTRYETNLAILKEAGISGADEILVATGTNFADSLSASAVGLPLMLVNGKGSGLNGAQIEFLRSVSGKKVTIIGGTGAVSEEMKAAIEEITGATVGRISGKTRHDTSVLIAQKYFNNPEYALITYAKNFPDGLAGGPLAYAMDAPLLLTNAGQEAIANKYIAAESIKEGYILGGDSAVSDATACKVFGLESGTGFSKAYYTE